MRESQPPMALRQVARLLNVKPYRIDRALAVGAVPEPALRISNRRVFEQEDIRRLADHFGVKLSGDEAV